MNSFLHPSASASRISLSNAQELNLLSIKNESTLNLFKGTRQERSLRKLRAKKMSHNLIK